MTDNFRLRLNPYKLAAGALLLVPIVLLLLFFERWPVENTSLGLDWFGIWRALRADTLVWGNQTGLLNPPWGVVIIYPLSWLPMRMSWGMVAVLTFAVLIYSVPRIRNRRRYRWSVLLVAVSFMAVRQVVDGNLEFLVILGILFCLKGFDGQNPYWLVAGVLMATVKPQEVGVFMPVLALYVLLTFPPRQWLKAALIVGVVVTITMLWGGARWLDGISDTYMRNSIVDMSLYASLTRLGLAPVIASAAIAFEIGVTLWVAWRTRPILSREKAGLLVAASLLAGPYSAPNSILTLLAIGLIPLYQKRPGLGLALIMLTNAGLFISNERFFNYIALYWTGVVAVIWASLVWWCLRAETKPVPAVTPAIEPKPV